MLRSNKIDLNRSPKRPDQGAFVDKYRHINWGPAASIGLPLIVYLLSAILVAIGAQLVLGAWLGWDEVRMSQWSETTESVFILMLASSSVIFGAIVWFLHQRKNTLSDIGWVKPTGDDFRYGLVGYLGYLALIFLTVTAIGLVWPDVVDSNQSQQIGFEPDVVAGLDLVMVFVGLVIIPPLIEEVLIRGFMFSGLRTKFNFWPAALISSVVFGFAHLQINDGGSVLWSVIIDTTLLGLVLAYLREKTGSLVAPMLVHATKNGLAFSLLFVFQVV